jgi:spiro-SPASM protein
MKAITVLYAADLSPLAFECSFGGKSAFARALERAAAFPGTERLVLVAGEGALPDLPPGVAVEKTAGGLWDRKTLLETLSVCSQGFDCTYFAWADCPLLDPALAGAVADRHIRYAAEYSYADGWPYGLAPEVLAPGTAGILAKILAGAGAAAGEPKTGEPKTGEPVTRDALFQVIQKDINAFDIETEISPVDLRQHRLSLTADSRRNCLLISRFIEAGAADAGDTTAAVSDLIETRPELLRTLPAFFSIQVAGGCPQACTLCPWPKWGAAGGKPVTSRGDYMEADAFEGLLDKIAAFAGDAVIDLSLWGEIALHPDKMKLAALVLDRPELALVLETAGIGWKGEELEALAARAAAAAPRRNKMAPLSWIVSLDAFEARRYGEIRGPGFAEAGDCARRLLALFPGNAYVQAVRCKGAEDDIEQFYRFWKEHGSGQAEGKGKSSHIIIQKYDDFCGALPGLQASDLSPVTRRPCWHIMRDVPVLLDGTVPFCREDLAALDGGGGVLGNLFRDPLETIWERGMARYGEHCSGEYRGICAGCDEYYTYNF